MTHNHNRLSRNTRRGDEDLDEQGLHMLSRQPQKREAKRSRAHSGLDLQEFKKVQMRHLEILEMDSLNVKHVAKNETVTTMIKRHIGLSSFPC